MKTSKKLLVLVLVLAMVFACAVPAWATTPVKLGYYVQAPSTNKPTVTGEFTVTLNIYSDTIGSALITRPNITVNMGSSGVTSTYYVSDVLYKAAQDNSWLTLYENASHSAFTSTSQTVYGVVDSAQGSTVFEIDPTNLGLFRGWMFRVNGQYPLLDPADYPSGHNVTLEGPCGAHVNETYVKNGDVIDLYFSDDIRDESVAPRSLYVDTTNITCTPSGNYYNVTMPLYVAYSYEEEYYPTGSSTLAYYLHLIDNTNYTYDYQQITDTPRLRVTIDNSSSWIRVSNGSITKNSLSAGMHTVTIATLPGDSYTINGVTYKFPAYVGVTFVINVQ